MARNGSKRFSNIRKGREIDRERERQAHTVRHVYAYAHVSRERQKE